MTPARPARIGRTPGTGRGPAAATSVLAGLRLPATLCLLAAFCLAATACAGDGHSIVDDSLGGGPIPPTLAGLQKNIFGKICINCHVPGGPGPMPLDTLANSYASLVNVESVEIPGLNRVTPGDPAASYIVFKINGTPGIVGDPMPPPPEARLSQAEIDAITQWIIDGANP